MGGKERGRGKEIEESRKGMEIWRKGGKEARDINILSCHGY